MNTPTIRALLEHSASVYGDAPFIRYMQDGKQCQKSFVQTRSDSLGVCRYLQDLPEEKMHIAVIGPTSYNYLAFLTGVLLSGHVAIPLSPELPEAELLDILRRADVSMLLYENSLEKKIPTIRSECPALRYTLNLENDPNLEKIFCHNPDTPLKDSNPDDCHVMIFTSGTTGTPKGVMLSESALVGNILYEDYCDDLFHAGDVALSVLPMHHIYCFTGDYLKNLKDGLQVCLNGKMRDLLANLLRYEPKVMRVVPIIAQSLLQRVRMIRMRQPNLSPRAAAEQVFGKNIRWLISGGAYLPPELISEYDQMGILLRQGYGMTEAGCRICVPDENVSAESVGRLMDFCKVRIENGEIQVFTPTAMLGYYKDDEATAAMFTADGFLKTGDIGYVTEDRQLFITGRSKNLIILSGGENVSPETIEKKFEAFDLVREVLVFAKDNRIEANIYPDFRFAESHGIEDIESALREIMLEVNRTSASTHRVTAVHPVSEPLPKTESGKLKRSDTTF